MTKYVDIPVPFEWNSGDCKPVLATRLSVEELSARNRLELFRAEDDLDWFVGAHCMNASFGPLLIMRHDHNPERLTAFYVDRGLDSGSAQAVIARLFSLCEPEIAWASCVP